MLSVNPSVYLLAFSYVWLILNFHLHVTKEWRRLHMKDFVKMTAGFVEELELPEAKPRVAAYESFYQQNADNSEMS